jgi:hypothetical protein
MVRRYIALSEKYEGREEAHACHVGALSRGMILLSALGPLVAGSCTCHRGGTCLISAVVAAVHVVVVAVRT